MSPPNLILHATTCLTLLGLTAKAALRAREDAWQILDAETGRALSTLQGDRVTVDAATLLPEELDRCVAPLLGPPLATRFFQQFPAAGGDWFLCVQGGHEISLRARDDTVLASGHLFEPASGVLFATVNTWNPLLHTLLPAPVPVGPGSNQRQARVLDRPQHHRPGHARFLHLTDGTRRDRARSPVPVRLLVRPGARSHPHRAPSLAGVYSGER